MVLGVGTFSTLETASERHPRLSPAWLKHEKQVGQGWVQGVGLCVVHYLPTRSIL